MNRKDELRKKMALLAEELNAIEQEESRKEREALAGRYFKYRNCYSCPKNESDYWWTYKHITDVKDDGVLGITFEIDKYGKIEIIIGDLLSSLAGWQEISKEEFDIAWLSLNEVIGEIYGLEQIQ